MSNTDLQYDLSNSTHEIELVHKNGSRARGKLIIGVETPLLAYRVHLTLRFIDKVISKNDVDYFSALSEIRRELDALDLRLNCYGASLNVAPSFEQRERGLGMTACLLRKGRPALPKDRVDIFDTGTDVVPSGVDEQKQFHREWLQSLGWEFDAKGKVVKQPKKLNPYNPGVFAEFKYAVVDFLEAIRSGTLLESLKTKFAHLKHAKPVGTHRLAVKH